MTVTHTPVDRAARESISSVCTSWPDDPFGMLPGGVVVAPLECDPSIPCSRVAHDSITFMSDKENWYIQLRSGEFAWDDFCIHAFALMKKKISILNSTQTNVLRVFVSLIITGCDGVTNTAHLHDCTFVKRNLYHIISTLWQTAQQRNVNKNNLIRSSKQPHSTRTTAVSQDTPAQ